MTKKHNMYAAGLFAILSCIHQSQGMDTKTSHDDWWGYQLTGHVSKNAGSAYTDRVRLQFENDKGIRGEVRAPITHIVCAKQYEDGILSSLIIQTDELFINDIKSEMKKSNFPFEKRLPENFCVSINCSSLDEFMKREPFKSKIIINYKQDLFEPLNTIFKILKKDFNNLEHVVVDIADSPDDSLPKHRWKLPTELNIFINGSPYSIWSIAFSSECSSGCERSVKPYERTHEEEEQSFKLHFDAYEKEHHMAYVKPDTYKLGLSDRCTSFPYEEVQDPYFQITLEEGWDTSILSLFVKSKMVI